MLVSFAVRISKIPKHENKWYNLCREAEGNIEGESICDSDDTLRNRKDFDWKEYKDSKIQGLTPNESALYAFVIIAILLHILFILWSLFGAHVTNQYHRRQNRLAKKKIRKQSKASMFNRIGNRFGFVGETGNARTRLQAQANADANYKNYLIEQGYTGFARPW